MKVLVIANPRSGNGGGPRAAGLLGDALELGDGRRVEVVRVGIGDPKETERIAREAEAIVVAGGDGSVHHAALLAMRTNKPLYHFPCGNENLFSREFGTCRSLDKLKGALLRGRTIRTDIGRVEGRGHFVLMASFGCDASVVHRLDAVRSLATGHMAYVRPVLAEMRRPCFPRLKAEGDGKPIVDGRRGLLLVANSRQYALRIDPACEASMTDGMLDVVFLPCRWVGSAMWCGLMCRLRRGHRIPGAVQVRTKQVSITACDGAVPYQVDGEAPTGTPGGGKLEGSLVMTVEPAVLPVLLPQAGLRTRFPAIITASTGSAPNS